MARPGLLRNRKFVRMERMKGMTKAIALGSLELIWSAAYETGEDLVGTAEDVELAADWRGEPGLLFAALRDAGLPGPGFIEEAPERPRMWRIHDLYDHAPDYVQRRMEREAERLAKGRTISDIRSEAAKARWNKEKDANGCKRPPLADPQDAKVLTPAPAPAPKEEALVSEAPASGDAWGRVSELWGSVCVPAGFAKARGTPLQKKAAQARMREGGWFEAFAAACRHAAGDPFYRGGGKTGWVMDLGWLLKPGNTEKTADRATTRRANGHTSQHDAELLRALAEAERDASSPEPPTSDSGDGGGLRSSPPLDPVEDDVATNGKPLSAAVRALMVHRWPAGKLQDATHVEPRAVTGRTPTPGAFRFPGTDDG